MSARHALIGVALAALFVEHASAAPACTVPANMANGFACTDPVAYPVFTRSLALISGRQYRVRTSNLSTWAGIPSTPDTVIRVLNPTSNTQIVSDDDTLVCNPGPPPHLRKPALVRHHVHGAR